MPAARIARQRKGNKGILTMGKRVVVEPGSYGCHNMGDIAMMQVAVTRLKELWPHAEIQVVTSSPALLLRYCPSATPLSAETRNTWLSGRSLSPGLHRKLPARLAALLRGMEKHLWMRHPDVTDLGVSLKSKLMRRPASSPSSFRKRLVEADLLVVSGMGGLNDAFKDSACPLLDELEFALQAGVPVVAFGQGIGPISDPELLERARAVLPRLRLIALREAYAGLPLLESLGVPRDRIRITGDDAIGLAYLRRPHSLGTAIGINLRLADYAGTGEDIIDMIRGPLRNAADAQGSSLVSVPISFHACDSDLSANSRLLGVQEQNLPLLVRSPEDVIDLVGRCRVVVTGSYHGAVFALAQGIPVVGLLQSAYYEQKFIGLQEQFPEGCRLIDFRGEISARRMEEEILGAWESAPRLREQLLEAAARQIELARAAYLAVHELCPLE